ncbi:sodium:solute symporter [uncultured Oscillibacter sp.]|uniref:sodium:solute symporter family protein n=1 Tax=uncultured Oscillibacter sp. TaxID=876091 RepID=UPI002626D621|nr:sodium:solute symporter family protein [uncultured Oscillibacter sp.]
MTSQVWMLLITVIYVLAMMLLSWYIGKKTTKDETEFMVGGREFTPLMTAVGNGSILISGGYLPSIIMYGYMFGMGGMWFYLGWGTGALVAWLCWAGFWRTSGALTPTEWFEYRYGKGGRMAITIVILFASLAILGWQYVGCGDTIGGALGIDPKLAMLLVGVVVTAYVVFGGIWAATATDLIQFSWVFVVQFLVLPVYLIVKYGMPDASVLPENFLSLPFGSIPVVQFVAPSVITFLMMHQSLLNQSPYWARAAGTRSLKSCKKGWMWTVIIAYFTGVVGAFTGCYARQLLPNLESASTAFGSLMGILPIPLAACIMAGLMAATMSTCDIYLVSGVNQLVRDVAQYFLKIRDTKKLLQWAKWGTIIYGLASVAFAIFWKGGLSYLFAFGTGVGAPLFVYYLDSWLLRVGNQKGAIASVAVSMGIVLYWDILTTNSARVNSLWLIFPASLITLVVVSLLTKTYTVAPVDAAKGPDALQTEVLKTLKRGYGNTGAIITRMTRYCSERQLQAASIHKALDSLEKSGYVKRKGQRLIHQLYFSLTEKGEAAAVAHMDAAELKTISNYGVDDQALRFMRWIENGDASMSDISGKYSIYMMELSAISEHLAELGLVQVFGQTRLRARLTNDGRKLLGKAEDS